MKILKRVFNVMAAGMMVIMGLGGVACVAVLQSRGWEWLSELLVMA